MSPADDDDDDDADDDAPEESAAGGFTGSLLVAHPGLRDPNFRRGVLYLTAHSPADGAMAVILNRPLADKTAADLLPGHEDVETLTRIPVYLGGPVGRDQLTFGTLKTSGGDGDGGGMGGDGGTGEVHFRHHLTLPEALALAAAGSGGSGETTGSPGDSAGLRAFVGYAGWAGGQLEGEIEASAWVLVPPRARFFAPRSKPGGEDRAWFRVMSSLGPVYKLLAAVPDDVTLN